MCLVRGVFSVCMEFRSGNVYIYICLLPLIGSYDSSLWWCRIEKNDESNRESNLETLPSPEATSTPPSPETTSTPATRGSRVADVQRKPPTPRRGRSLSTPPTPQPQPSGPSKRGRSRTPNPPRTPGRSTRGRSRNTKNIWTKYKRQEQNAKPSTRTK